MSDINISAADINTDQISDLDVGMVEVEDSDNQMLPAAVTSGGAILQTPPDQDAVVTEKERIFMSDLNRMITQYNAHNKWQDDASTRCLPQKRPSSSLTVTHERREESTAMNTSIEIKTLLKAEEKKGIHGGLWAERARELMKYRDDHGHCNVPCRNISSLGNWVGTQRAEFKKFGAGKYSNMTPQRIKILNQIGFVWIGRVRYDEGWMKMFKELMKYKEKYGDCLVPRRYEGNPKLGRWVYTQRFQYQNKKEEGRTRTTEERQRKLKEIGFVWDPSKNKIDMRGATGRRDEGWMLMLKELMKYKEKHGDCLVPNHYAGNPKLGRWVHKQRHVYREKKKGNTTQMSNERIKKLEEIGFV
eukprot:CAMPEP_0116023680 /NCGR_PEP_ID=MMETSP0321-20121206/11774_1 /TAXON_ID=163516 /ORGANISM="Leptocylindrus danicus var. danicus, Strain B650" /LENGTH=358 /DNA_ID=CAMNT_0003495083 /DNA_START=85 /DNA_END=1162 /DNA_ORIENTATION=+